MKKGLLLIFPILFLFIANVLAVRPVSGLNLYVQETLPAQKLLITSRILFKEPSWPVGPNLQPQKTAWTKPQFIRGIYATGWMTGSSKWFPEIVQFISTTEVNALVIDVKDDTGTLSYLSAIPLVKQLNAAECKIPHLENVLDVLQKNKIFPIARIVVFKDPFMAKKKPEWAIKSSHGGLWSDRKGLNWIDPYNKQYWDYIVAISKEAIERGFQEIQYDYVRFASDGDVKRCIYPYANGKLREDVIKEFLQYARAQLKPYNIPISADIFGLSTSLPDDLGIGQRFEKIAANVDIVCPMVYPSHYIPGNFGLKHPDLQPYETVYRSLSDAKKRLHQAGLVNTRLRPWLQDFSLASKYERAQIQAQIQAVSDAGINEWIFWNPSNRYQIKKYQ